MSTKIAAFKATYSEWRLIKTRQVVQVVFEVPLKDHDEAYQALGGMPDPAAERWFGIARLDLSVAGAGTSPAGRPRTVERQAETRSPGGSHEVTSHDPDTFEASASDEPAPTRMRKPVAADKRLAQQCGIACADPLFQKFVRAKNEETAAEYVRQTCGVTSRKEIKIDTPEGEIWQGIYGEFLIWRDAPELAPNPRMSERQREPAV